MHFHSSREPHGVRAWWHFTHPRCIHVEFYWWSNFCGFTVGTDDEGWNLSLRVPPLALYFSLEGFPIWQPRYPYTSYTGESTTLPDRREFSLTLYDWTIRLGLWERWGEWRSSDPWWIRGVSLNLKDLVLGRWHCEVEELGMQPCVVPMPEGNYPAVAKIQRRTWRRPRWFSRTRTDVWLDIPKGIPHAGKGENSWDCGDDGLYGIGGATLDDAIQRARDTVLRKRKSYGHASDKAMREALTP